VFGKDYLPDTSDRPFVEQGIASWYGRRFNGQRTSSGEVYDMYAMTAAHPTLPIPSYARVTNPSNGRSVIVRINDRGPFHSGRIIDLSFAAAYRLGYANVGSTMVQVERLLPRDIAAGRYTVTAPVVAQRDTAKPAAPAASRPNTAAANDASPLAAVEPSTNAPGSSVIGAQASTSSGPGAASGGSTASPTGLSPGDLPSDLVPAEYLAQNAPRASAVPSADLPLSGHYVQLAAFRARAGAEGFMQHLTRELDPTLATRLRITAADSFYRVQLGPYGDRNEAEGAASRLKGDLGIETMIVTPR
jgi:rare lipoprotein A